MLAFFGVFGDFAVTARAEETHCAALRRLNVDKLN